MHFIPSKDFIISHFDYSTSNATFIFNLLAFSISMLCTAEVEVVYNYM